MAIKGFELMLGFWLIASSRRMQSKQSKVRQQILIRREWIRTEACAKDWDFQAMESVADIIEMVLTHRERPMLPALNRGAGSNRKRLDHA